MRLVLGRYRWQVAAIAAVATVFACVASAAAESGRIGTGLKENGSGTLSSFGATARSSLWRGRLRISKPPGVKGPVRVNKLVTPFPGKWKGGWSDAEDWFQLSACRSPRGHGCTTLTDMHYPYGCPDFAVVLKPEYEGWYLRVADMRVASGTGILDYAVGSPEGQRVWKRSRQVAVAIVGKIAPASGPRTETCGLPPWEVSSTADDRN